MVRRAILIDGSSLIYKCFFSLDPDNCDLEDPKHKQRFFNILQMQIRKWLNLNHYVAGLVVFDVDKKSFRNDLFPEYKENREPMPEFLLEWLPESIEKISSLGIKAVFCPKGYEGDDLIGTVSNQLSKCDYKVDIFSTDKDFLQLVDYLISVYRVKNSFHLEVHNHVNFSSLNEGLFPYQIPLLKALAGDHCDNYPGIPGIGSKKAIKLIEKYKTLGNLLNSIDTIKPDKTRDVINENKELLLKCFQLATIQTNIKFKYALSDCYIKNENNSGFR